MCVHIHVHAHWIKKPGRKQYKGGLLRLLLILPGVQEECRCEILSLGLSISDHQTVAEAPACSVSLPYIMQF